MWLWPSEILNYVDLPHATPRLQTPARRISLSVGQTRRAAPAAGPVHKLLYLSVDKALRKRHSLSVSRKI